MGAWGYKALENDTGSDVLFLLREYISNKPDLKLDDFISVMKLNGFFDDAYGKTDYVCDQAALAIVELYIVYHDISRFKDDSEADCDLKKMFCNVKSFSADRESLFFLLRYLVSIRDEESNDDGEREILSIWKRSRYWDEWKKHLLFLVERIETELVD